MYFQLLPRALFCMRGPSLVGLTGDDSSAALAVTVQIRMSSNECISSIDRYVLLYSNPYSNIPRSYIAVTL